MQDSIEMRKVYCNSLVKMAETNKDIVVIEADLMKCIQTDAFKAAYPDRFFDVGIAEANMIGVSAGLASCGKIPFCSSFATFATRRCYDQIFISVAYSQLNVKIVGTDPGISAELNGGTHMPFEDMGIMRNIPNMVCIEPTDATMLASLMPQITAYNGAVYLRLFRKKCERVFEDNTNFDMFKAVKIQSGSDVTIVCSGIMVSRAIEASAILASENIHATILNIFTWKPIDTEAIIDCANATGAIVTAENHNVINGLYSAVSEVVSRNCPVPMESVGVNDQFGEVGKMPFLSEKFKLQVSDIVDAVKKVVARKK